MDNIVTKNGTVEHFPDVSTVKLSHMVLLKWIMLPVEARRAHIFKELKKPLISISQLCDSGYLEIFDKYMIYILKKEITILSGKCNENGLYMINMEMEPSQQP